MRCILRRVRPETLAAHARATATRTQRPARRFWIFWSASTISQTGDAITALALPLAAIRLLRATPFEISLLTAGTFGAWLLIGLPAGAIVHRWPLRRVQIAADLTRAVVLASVPVAAMAGVLSIAQLVGAAFAVGLASVVFDVANSTFIVSVVSSAELTARNSVTSASTAATQTAGPSVAGLLISLVGAAGAVIFDVASYLVSALLLSRLPGEAAGDHGAEGQPSVRAAVRDGWRYVIDHPVIGPCAAMATAINFVCGGLMALGPVYLVRTLHASFGLVGLLMACEGVGTLVGAACTTTLARRVGSARLLVRATAGGGLCALLIPLAGSGPGLILFAVGMAGFAAGVVVLSILARTHRQDASPAHLLPRVMATVRFVSWGVIPLGAVMAGLLGGAIGLRATIGLYCALALTVPVIGMTTAVGRLRDLGVG